MSPHSEFAAMAVTRLRNAQHSDHAFDICEEIFAEAIAAERERCANICADIAGEVDWSARGIMQMDAEQVGIECAKQIRGEK